MYLHKLLPLFNQKLTSLCIMTDQMASDSAFQAPVTIEGSNGGTLVLYQKGNPGNPKGRGKGNKRVSTILKQLLSQSAGKDHDGNPLTHLQKICGGLIRSAQDSVAASDRLAATREIFDRTEGRAKQTLETSHTTRKIDDVDQLVLQKFNIHIGEQAAEDTTISFNQLIKRKHPEILS